MAENRKVVRVFLASPGDLSAERQAAKAAVDEFNQTWSAQLGYHIELVGWELTVSRFGRPQALINRDLETCEYFIGLMWKKWGTPPDIEGQFTSGFDEEFQMSLKRRRETGRPEISLFFKRIDPELIRDPGDELKRVLLFRKTVIDQKELLFEEFTDVSDFQEKIRRSVSSYVQALMKEEESIFRAESQSTLPSEPTTQAPEAPDGDPVGLISGASADFVRDFASKAQSLPPGEFITPLEVARFRLVGATLYAPGTDEEALGVHDSNIIFFNRHRISIGGPEVLLLLQCGLANYDTQNVPTWHWFRALKEPDTLRDLSIAGRSGSEKIGALQALRDLGQPFSVPTAQKPYYFDAWFAKDSPPALRTAALNYLACCGSQSDLPAAKAELERKDYSTARAALEAVVRINLRDSRKKAIEILQELQPDSIESSLADDIFAIPAQITSDSLRQLLGNRNAELRKHALAELIDRREIDAASMEAYLEDSDRSIRLLAMKFLETNGRRFEDKEAKENLITKSNGLFGFSTANNEDLYDEFKSWSLTQASDQDLKRLFGQSIFDMEPEFILSERMFSEHSAKLRTDVRDHFNETFESALASMSKAYGGNSEELIQKIRSLKDHITKKHTRRGLEIICRAGEIKDLGLVRSMLAAGKVEYSHQYIEYLRLNGEWDDISSIITALELPGATGVTLTVKPFENSNVAARAIYDLGRDRLADLLSLEMPNTLRTRLVVISAEDRFAKLGDDQLFEWFKSGASELRKAVALKCVRTLPRKRLEELLDRYIDQAGYRYYNVIHWLDLGISLPRSRARVVAASVMGRDWR